MKHPDYQFDIEQYNFIYKSSSYFTLNERICLDYEHLKYILTNMNNCNPLLLDLLQFYSSRSKNREEFDSNTLKILEQSIYNNPHVNNKIVDKSEA